MQRKMVSYMFVLLFLSGATFLFAGAVRASGPSVTVTPDPAAAAVAVSVSDAELNGKEISVICYEPGFTGKVNDITANKKHIVYMNQYTVNGSVSFQFQVKKQIVEGEYTLVVTSVKGQTIKTFRLAAKEEPAKTTTPSAQPVNAPGTENQAGAEKSSAKTSKLSAPKAVKAKASGKKKVKVTWKKVKGAKGYQISTAKKKKGTYKVKLTVKGASKKAATLKKMKKGKVYIKVRAYKLSGKKKIAGKYSKPVGVKVR